MDEYELQSDEKKIYIANIPDTKDWMMVIAPKPPKVGFYRGYVVPSDRMPEAMVEAEGLVSKLQGRFATNVELPVSLI